MRAPGLLSRVGAVYRVRLSKKWPNESERGQRYVLKVPKLVLEDGKLVLFRNEVFAYATIGEGRRLQTRGCAQARKHVFIYVCAYILVSACRAAIETLSKSSSEAKRDDAHFLQQHAYGVKFADPRAILMPDLGKKWDYTRFGGLNADFATREQAHRDTLRCSLKATMLLHRVAKLAHFDCKPVRAN